MKKYLKIKDCAKILHFLYKGYFNRLANKEIYVSLEITKKQKEKFSSYQLTDEEIWVYANEIMDSSYILKKNRNFEKQEFLKVVVLPLVKVFPPDSECTIQDFIMKHHLCNGIEDDINWLSAKEKRITLQEADRIIGNVIKFLEE